MVRERSVIERLEALGYSKVAGNRFAKRLDDVPVRVGDDDSSHRAVIDVLVPAYTSRLRQDRRIGDKLVTTEVPGLAIADEVSALLLKALATTARSRDTDV